MINRFYSKYSPIFFIVLQLIVIGGFIHHFNIEAQFNLSLLFPLVGGSFLIHAISPIRYRTWVFIGATILGLSIILSWEELLTFLMVSFGIIGICNLSISLNKRKLVLLALAGILAYLRINSADRWMSSTVLALLGTIFMFRLLVFLYELKYQKERIPVLAQVSYFLMLPNIIFPLFPVVDFKAFYKNYQGPIDLEVYKRGVYLISKGVLFLFFYRLIYSFLLPSTSEIESLSSLIQYLVFSYLLTLRLAGIFHFSVGVLHLFGYKLPDIFHHHFFASGFGDLWRRLNIYWKDFIVKLYFNPLYFRFKGLGPKKALFIATMISFALTLFYHQYQTFWLTGVLSVGVNDIVFWGFFGAIVAIGVLIPPELIISRPLWQSMALVVKVIATFFTVSLIWTLWSNEDIISWMTLMSKSSQSPAIDWVMYMVCLLLFVGVGGVIHFYGIKNNHKIWESTQWKRLLHYTPIVIFILLIGTFNRITLVKYWNLTISNRAVESIFHFTLNADDQEKQMAGYYDEILISNNGLRLAKNETADHVRKVEQSGVVIKSDDIIEIKLVPKTSAWVDGILYDINEWGMRDQPYDSIPDDKTIRLAMSGVSIEMGWRVNVEDSFGQIIEQKLNDTANDDFELMNFSVYAREIIQQAHFADEIIQHDPEVIMFFHHYKEWVVSKGVIKRLKDLGYRVPMLAEANQLLEKYPKNLSVMDAVETDVVGKLHQNIYDKCSKKNIKLILVMMPKIETKQMAMANREETLDVIAENAHQIGFEVIDLRRVLDSFDRSSLQISEGDQHPNEKGNQILADALFPRLKEFIHRN